VDAGAFRSMAVVRQSRASARASTVVVIQNDLAEPLPVRIKVGDSVVAPTLPADSFSTLVVKGRPEGDPSSSDSTASRCKAQDLHSR
jgi:hypothetical protein